VKFPSHSDPLFVDDYDHEQQDQDQNEILDEVYLKANPI
jgi:hypothetical protein